jgi:putative membrane protein
MKRTHATVLALGVLTCAACGAPTDDDLALAPPASEADAARAPRSPLSLKDQRALRTAAVSDINEIGLAALALERAIVPHVRAFAQQMDREHRAMRDAKEALAQARAVRLPQHMSVTHTGMRVVLGRLKGEAFDVAYIDSQVTDHRATLSLLKVTGQTADDADLRALALHDIPLVEHHLRLAEALARGDIPREFTGADRPAASPSDPDAAPATASEDR